MRKKYPALINRPLQILVFESDELIITFCCYLLGNLLHNFYLMIILIFGGYYSYKKMKKKFPRGFLLHGLYFLGFRIFEGYPPFDQDTFIE